MDRREDRARAVLEAAGFVYNKAADSWVHQVQGRVISAQTVAAHDPEWLIVWIVGTGSEREL
jgi:hypothetical protein